MRAIAAHSAPRYILVGGLAFIVDAGLVALFYEGLAVNLALSTAMGFLVSFVFSYLVQRAFSFSFDGPIAGSVGKYVLLVAFNMVANILVVELFSSLGWGWFWGKVVSTVLIASWNYFLFRFWIFRVGRAEPNPVAG